MVGVNRRVRTLARRAGERAAPTAMAYMAEVWRLGRDLGQLRQRVIALEAEVQETRRLNRRVAELTDVVEEVLLPAADRDDERLRQAVQQYGRTL